MARNRPQLAKLSRPRLHAPLPRDRLFRLLDNLRGSAVVWVEGPPGAGKTTTVATYVDAARIPCLWYQLDSGDADPASFFYYIREAASALCSKGARLPLLTPEQHADVGAFGRRFFRTLFQRLPPSAVIVLDNYQEVSLDSSVHEVVAQAAEEVPAGANIIVLSRLEPPKVFARARLAASVVVLGWDALRLTIDETRSIAAARGEVDDSSLAVLHRDSQGWVAGVVLMVERWRGHRAMTSEHPVDGPEATFDYFASQIFDAAPLETRELLMKTAPFPSVTVDVAEAVSGNPEAARVLDLLHRRRLFVDRRPGRKVLYEYHALFREFLRHQAKTQQSPHQYRQSILQAANLLSALGHEIDAFALYCEATDWKAAISTLTTAAARLIGQGRLKTIEDCVAQLPEQWRHEADVAYWMGMALEPTRPIEARPWLQRAYDAYVAQSDHSGQLLSAAGVIDSFYVDYSNFAPARQWTETFTQLLESAQGFSSPEVELRIRLSLLSIVQHMPENRLLPVCARRAEELLALPLDVNLKVVAGHRLVHYGEVTCDSELCCRVFRMISPLLGAAELIPANAAVFMGEWGYYLYIVWRVDEALVWFERARAVSQREGLHDEYFRALVYAALCLRRAGRLGAAEAARKELVDMLPQPTRGVRASMGNILDALIAYSRGDLGSAIEHGSAAQRIVDDAMNVFNGVIYRAVNGGILIAAGRLDDASQVLQEARASASGTVIDPARAHIALNQAHIAHLRGNAAERDQYLREALAFGGSEGARARMRWFPRAMQVLFPIALREGIEPALVRTLARKFSLTPPALHTEEWPWPIKVYTLGRFEIWLDSTRLTFDRRAPRKTLALLQALIAFGARDVAEERLLEALWPDDEGDAGHRAFTQALHRLRKLLVDAMAIRQASGKLSLDRERCWVDAFSFEALLESDATIEQALDLYRGPFLTHDDDLRFAFMARERMRARFIEAIGKLAERKERQADFEGAIEVYRRGLAADELAEPFYQGLMRCYARLDRCSDAVGAYRRMRQTLSVVLGTQPSAASERLYRELQSSDRNRFHGPQAR